MSTLHEASTSISIKLDQKKAALDKLMRKTLVTQEQIDIAKEIFYLSYDLAKALERERKDQVRRGLI